MAALSPPHAISTVWKLLIAGGVMLGIILIAAFFRPKDFFYGYLTAYLFWLGISWGSAVLLMIHHLTGGHWGWHIRKALETGTITLPLLGIAFLPLFFGLDTLYEWARQNSNQTGNSISYNATYLNPTFFAIRAVCFWIAWIGFGLRLESLSRRQRFRKETSVRLIDGLQRISAAGLVIFGLTMSFAAIDWVGSLTLNWYSSVLGMYLIVGQVLSAFTLILIIRAFTSGDPADSELRQTRIDLGNLLLTLIVLHAYLAYSQFFIIWNGNEQEEVAWYMPRTQGVWGITAVVLILAHFVLPFAALLFRRIKQTSALLTAIATVVLGAGVLESFWMVLPADPDANAWTVILTFFALLGIGGIWLAVFVWRWEKIPPVPLRVQEESGYE